MREVASERQGCVEEGSRREFLGLGLAAAASSTLAPVSAWAQESGASAEWASLTLKEVSELVRSRAVSPVELARACLGRIERYDPALNAFITVASEAALERARAMEAELDRGQWRGPLHGVPIALKDNIDTADIRTTGASELFEDRVPSTDAAVAERLKAAGAVLLGKLNLHEFAYGGTSTVTHYGTIHNPWSLDRVTGGSSGGSAAAVAADLCYGALGTDTAGSVRMPASHCGITGLKPTYGRVSMRGIMTLSWTLDHVGPMCKSAEDAALLLSVMAGYDAADPTTVDRPVPDYADALRMDPARLRLGIPRVPFYDDVDPEVERAVEQATQLLRTLTAGVREVRLPETTVSGAALWGPEAYAFHRRWIAEAPEKYKPSTLASLNRYASSAALDYVEARRAVDLARRRVIDVFSDVEVLVTPTMCEPAPPLADGGGSGRSAGASLLNIFGLPAVSIPCGFTASGLPIGLQIVGAPFAEATVLGLAHAYQQVTDWHRQRPQLPRTALRSSEG